MNYLVRNYSKTGVLDFCEQFESIRRGERQRPVPIAQPAAESFAHSETHLKVAQTIDAKAGPFGRHFHASIPLVLEEHIRLGAAILEISKLHKASAPLTVYETDSQDGTLMRAIAELAEARCVTVWNGVLSATDAHLSETLHEPNSYFINGCFCDVDQQALARLNASLFQDRLDVYFENATFQFYDTDRHSQIAFARSLLKPDGLYLTMEKCRHSDMSAYKLREDAKNRFKIRYFRPDELEWKSSNILTQMEYQVEVCALADALHRQFTYVALIWTSANFYEFVASDSNETFQRFLDTLAPPYLDPNLCFAPEPKLRPLSHDLADLIK